MPTDPQLTARLRAVHETVGARLNRLDRFFPEQQERLPFTEYLARASLRAQADPDFAAQLQRSLQQYRAASEVFNGRFSRR